MNRGSRSGVRSLLSPFDKKYAFFDLGTRGNPVLNYDKKRIFLLNGDKNDLTPLLLTRFPYFFGSLTSFDTQNLDGKAYGGRTARLRGVWADLFISYWFRHV